MYQHIIQVFILKSVLDLMFYKSVLFFSYLPQWLIVEVVSNSVLLYVSNLYVNSVLFYQRSKVQPKFCITSASREFIEHRRKALRRFLHLIVRHPTFHRDAIVKYFFTFKGSVGQHGISDLILCFCVHLVDTSRKGTLFLDRTHGEWHEFIFKLHPTNGHLSNVNTFDRNGGTSYVTKHVSCTGCIVMQLYLSLILLICCIHFFSVIGLRAEGGGGIIKLSCVII